MIIGILLAAGQSERFGSDKLSLVLPNQETVGLLSAKKLMAVCEQVIVVVNPVFSALHQAYRDLGCTVLVNTNYQQGMGSSLVLAVRHSPICRAWLVALADMPFIQTQTYASITTALEQGAALAAPVYQQQRGHPVGFAYQWREELLALDRDRDGDRGAGQLLKQHAQQLQTITCDDKGIVWDIDTPQDHILSSEKRSA